MRTARVLFKPIIWLLLVGVAALAMTFGADLLSGSAKAAGFANSASFTLFSPPPPFVRCVTTGAIDPSCNDTHTTIQGAINAALPGDTILIAPGTYIEQITVNKNLTITTTGPGVVIQSPSTPLVPDAVGQLNIVTITGGVNVSISNLVVLGPGPGPCASINSGIFVSGNSVASITGLIIPEIHDNPFGGCQNGVGIQVGKQSVAQLGHAVITNTAVSNYQKAGIVVDGTGSDATITGDTIDGHGNTTLIAQNGIQISRGATAIVDNNLVQGNEFDGPGSGSDILNDVQSVGILLFNAGDGTVIENNNVTANDIGIYDLNLGAVNINNNHLTINRYGGIVQDQGTGNLNHNTVSGGLHSVFVASFSGATGDSIAILNGNTLSPGPGGTALDTGDADTGDAFVPFFQNVFCAAPPAGLVSWYPGDGNATDVAGGHDGTLVGGATFSPAGEVGQAFNFNGINAGVSVPDTASLNFGANSDFSIDAWIHIPTSANPTKTVVDIVDKRSFSPNPMGYSMFLLNGQLGVQLADGATVHNYVGPSTGELRDGQFHFVAATVTRASAGTFAVNLYVDGVLKDTITSNAILGDLTNTGALQIAFNPDPGVPAATKFAPGLFDEIEIFNRALSSADVASLFNPLIAGKCKVTDVGLTKTHTGTFTVGLTGTYNLTVTNVGTLRATSPITVSDTLPAGMSFLAVGAGSDPGWLCSGSTTVNCTNNTQLPVSASFPLNLDVTVTQGGARTNNAVVSMFGDSNSGNDNASDTLTVAKANTNTALASSVNPSVFGQPVTFTATVTATGITPVGNVEFFDGLTSLGVFPTSGGIASVTVSNLNVGSHSVTAQFTDGGDFNNSTASALNQVVNPANTNTSLVSSVNPSVFQQTVTFTATVTVVPPGGGTLSNTVTFRDGTTVIDVVPIGPGGVATTTRNSLSVGSHPITASYNGDGAHNGSLSNTVVQIVNKANTTLTLTSSANPGNPGGIVMFTATIGVVPPGSGSPIPPTGTVTFKEGATTLGIRPVGGPGVATFSTSLLGAGQHSITAFYSGDGNFNPSTSNTLVQTMGRADMFVNQSTGQDPVMVGDTLHFDIGVGSGGPNDAFNVVLHLNTPSGTFFAGVTPDVGSCTAPQVGLTGAITCSLGNFSPGENHHVHLDLFVDTTYSTITNVAHVTTDSLDPDLTNNTISRTVKVTLISALSMTSVPVSSKATTVTVIGTNFQGGSTVEVNGVSRPATMVSSGRLSVTLTASDLSKTGTLTLRVVDPSGRKSNAKTLNVVSSSNRRTHGEQTGEETGNAGGSGTASPATQSTQPTTSGQGKTVSPASNSGSPVIIMPTTGVTDKDTKGENEAQASIDTLSVTDVQVGSKPVTVKITGANFDSGLLIQVNGESRVAKLIDANTMSITLTSEDLSKTGTLTVNVIDQQGHVSNAKVIDVTASKKGKK